MSNRETELYLCANAELVVQQALRLPMVQTALQNARIADPAASLASYKDIINAVNTYGMALQNDRELLGELFALYKMSPPDKQRAISAEVGNELGMMIKKMDLARPVTPPM